MRLLAALLIVSVPCGFSQGPFQPQSTKQLTVEQLLRRMTDTNGIRTAALGSYTCLRRYALRNQRFHTAAEMTVRMTYLNPGQRQFDVLSERGSSFIRHRVLRRMIESEQEANRDGIRSHTQITPDNYTFQLLGTDVERERPSYVLSVAPKTGNKFLLRGRIWVDAGDFAIIRIEGSPAQNPSRWISKTIVMHRYGKFGPFWLPVSNRSETDVLIFGHTEVTIDYWDYQINRSEQDADER